MTVERETKIEVEANAEQDLPPALPGQPKRSRRHFLKIAGGMALLGATASLRFLPLDSARTLAQTGDWVEQNIFPASGQYTSPVRQINGNFNALAAYWEVTSGDGSALNIQIRTSTDGTNFGAWTEAHLETHQASKSGSNQTRHYSELLFLSGSYVQYKLDTNGVALKLVGVAFIDSMQGSSLPLTPMIMAQVAGNAPNIISRAQWGANEGWRYANGKEVWSCEYRTPQVMIVHHSETTNTYNGDPAVDVRGIYYYHALTKGWGDIGYNYLIDWKGNIYEGRYGGDDVVGGHAYQYNYGSIGVCLIGSFMGAAPTTAQTNALVQLLSWKARVKSIDPMAKIHFVDRDNVACISGHRDVIGTSCPGDTMYPLLPSIRQRVVQDLGLPNPAGVYGIQLVSVKFSPTILTPGNTLRVDATIKNTGTLPIETQDPAPGFTYQQGQTYETLNFAKINNKFRFAVDYSGNSGVSHPYRWGFGKTLAPGETVSITGYIKLTGKASTQYWGGIVQEYIKYFTDNIGQQTIAVQEGTTVIPIPTPNPIVRATSKAADKNIRYFPETGHNLGYAFRNYWETRGGLAIFGFPITEEFPEKNPSDGKTYTVQYFERNRFELHPENAGTANEVLLGLLGNQLTQGRNFPKATPFTTNATSTYFPQTGHSLSNVFAKYWWSHGGLAIFGYPISEEFQEQNPDDGKTYTVQYFERNRFEYHPENRNTQYEVLLGLLGKQVLRQKGWI
ncbi:MAG: N-acetylmuramoyl-L-alanine amidase [Chloroflexi bacterium]|nr:N-acetylmuramoyl-L-alanine amidase [Chloroflexota bacterium]